MLTSDQGVIARAIDDGLLCLFREDVVEEGEPLSLRHLADRWKGTGLRRADLFAALDRLSALALIRAIMTDNDVAIALTPKGERHLASVQGKAHDCWAGDADTTVFRMTGCHRHDAGTLGRGRRATDGPPGEGPATVH
ncbi:MAG TPA: hypothetical protein VJM11_13250 [Nevskiaceae bacterium]|nr:hypothetical protein [Nevskiaceae bacterium]